MTTTGNSKEIAKMANQALDLPMEEELRKIEADYRNVLAKNGEKEEKWTITTIFATVVTLVGGSITGAFMGVLDPVVPVVTVVLLPVTWPFLSVACAIPNLLFIELFAKKKKLLKNAYALELGVHLYEEYGITLLSKPEPRRSLRDSSSKDLIYYGKMKKGGRKFKGSIYRNKEGFTVIR